MGGVSSDAGIYSGTYPRFVEGRLLHSHGTAGSFPGPAHLLQSLFSSDFGRPT